MSYKRINAIIRQSAKADGGLILSQEQISKLKTAAGVALAVIAVGGVISISLLAPNLLAALGSLHKQVKGGRKHSAKDKARSAARVIYYLKRHGYINMAMGEKGWKVRLSGLGKTKMAALSIESLAIPNPGRWDGKWWQVAADIPTEHYRKMADLLRAKLKSMNFYSLQRSLWFYPHDPRKEVEFASQYYRIAHFVTLMEVSKLDKDDETVLLKYFKSKKII
jgi:hypothetical protein